MLEPVKDDWEWVKKLRELGALDDDVVAAVKQKVPQRKQAALKRLFP